MTGQETETRERAPLVYASAKPEERRQLDTLLTEIDSEDSRSVLFFGSRAQQQLTTVSDQMLEGVRNKDVDAAGSALGSMVATLRGFDPGDLDPSRRPGLLDRLLGRARSAARFLQRYEEVRRQIDRITDELEDHKTRLLTDVASLDRLYRSTLEYFHGLEFYIAAGEEKLRQLDQELIPAREREAAASPDVLAAQRLRDLRAFRAELDRRIHDLRLTRQVTMQSLPGIRLVQENDKGLVGRIESTLINTVPLWRQQLATAVTVFRSGEAARTVRAASDLTNELLEANAERLRTANAETRRELERGVFDVEAVRKANANLIATIEDGLRIADEGRRSRVEAARQLEACEAELRRTLGAAASREQGEAPEGPT